MAVPVADPPGGIVMITGELLPVPFNDTCCGLVVALSAMLRVAVSSPVAVGVNVTPIVQLAFAAKVPVGLQGFVPLLASAKLLLLSPVIEKLVKLTGPVPVFVTVTFCAGLVELTVCDAKVSDVGDTVTVAGPFTAVPVNVTVCGLPVALSVNVIAPVRVPAAVGLNEIWKVQLDESTAMLGHCAVVAPAKSPVVTMLVKVTFTLPLFETVTVCVALVVPTVCEAKVSIVGEIVIVPKGAAPVPLNVTVCGLPVALSDTFKVAVRVPTAVGVNKTLIVQFAPPARVPIGLHPPDIVGKGKLKSPAFVPVTVNPEKFTVAVPLFVTVTVSAALVVPTVCAAKVKLVGATVTPDVAGVGMDCATTTCGCTEGAGSDAGPVVSRKIASYGETMYPDSLPCSVPVSVKCPDAFTPYVKVPSVWSKKRSPPGCVSSSRGVKLLEAPIMAMPENSLSVADNASCGPKNKLSFANGVAENGAPVCGWIGPNSTELSVPSTNPVSGFVR